MFVEILDLKLYYTHCICNTYFFADSRENYEESCENRTENQTSGYHLHIAGDGSTIAVTVEHGSSVAPEPLHSENNKNIVFNYFNTFILDFFLFFSSCRRKLLVPNSQDFYLKYKLI